MSLDLDALKVLAFGRNPMAWFECHARIQTKEVGTQEDAPPRCNEMQALMGRVIAFCLRTKRPIRIIIYKPRQKGCSTGTVACLYALTRARRMRCLVIGGQDSQTDNLWKILRYYSAKDKAPWGNSWTDNTQRAVCSNGSLWERETAGDKEAGRSGTYQALIVTEPARWPTEGAKNAADVLNSVLNCVPDLPGTCVIWESTANGPVGPFPENWAGAVTLEQAEAGELGNGYIKIFCPWFYFADSTLPLPPGMTPEALRKKLAADDPKALRVWQENNLTPEQAHWFHYKLNAPECGGDTMKRDREYPTTPADGFRASAPSRFSTDALAQLSSYAESRTADLLYGTLELAPAQRLLPVELRDYSKVSFIAGGKIGAEISIIEYPKAGCSYIVATDNCKGQSLVSGDETDCNALVVIRNGYYDHERRWHHAEVVASLMPGNRWDQDQLAELAARVSGFYGNATVVPESNRAELLIAELRKRRVLLWRRERPKDEVDSYKDSGLVGFETTGDTKKALVENLARCIRELNTEPGGFRCAFPWILTECSTFVRHKDGTEGALKQKGVHDDHVMALAIGMMTKEAGTTYHPPQLTRDYDESPKGRSGGKRGPW
jgi:hypothetical protein